MSLKPDDRQPLTPKLNDNERKVLSVLASGYGETCYYFSGIAENTGLERKAIRRACRSLAKKGMAEFTRGLFNDDGQVAGSGYGATRQGCERDEADPLPEPPK